MIIGIANDHHGLEIKKQIINYLSDKGIKYVDYGTNTKDSVDYVDYAKKLCNSLNNKEVNLGVLICGTGIGMSIAANKISGIRCARVCNLQEAHLSKEHNMANVIALAEYTINVEEIIKEFINTDYSNDKRHLRRVEKIMNLK